MSSGASRSRCNSGSQCDTGKRPTSARTFEIPERLRRGKRGRTRSTRQRCLGLILGACFISAAEPASAGGLGLVNSSLIAMFQSVSGQNVCLVYSYDQNGNRVHSGTLSFGPATWGSSTYGCFSWTVATGSTEQLRRNRQLALSKAQG